MNIILEGGIISDDDSIEEDALRDVDCFSSDSDEDNSMIRDINRLMMPSAAGSMFD